MTKSHISLPCGLLFVAALCSIATTPMSEAFAGSLLVGDESNGVIRRYDSSTGVYLGVFASGGGLTTPEGLTFGPDGNLYVSDFYSGVLRYDGQTGAFLGVCADVAPNHAYDVAFGPTFLYVGMSGGSIAKYYYPSGGWEGSILSPNSAFDLGGMTYQGGFLFVTYISSSAGHLYRCNVSTEVLTDVYDGFSANGPRGPRFGPDGNLYVPDWQTPHVLKFNGTTLAYQGYLINDTAHVYPRALAFDSDGTLYVLEDNGSTSSINRYNPATGAFLSQLVASGSGGLGRASSLVLVPVQRTPLLVEGAQRWSGFQLLHLAWTNNLTSYVLESSTAFTGTWSTVSTPCVTNGSLISTVVANPGSPQFYRLRAN